MLISINIAATQYKDHDANMDFFFPPFLLILELILDILCSYALARFRDKKGLEQFFEYVFLPDVFATNMSANDPEVYSKKSVCVC